MAEDANRNPNPPSRAEAGSQFLAWMNRQCPGWLWGGICWNWKINGVLVTFWMLSRLVKIYHDEGRQTECHPSETERCREAVMAIANSDYTTDGLYIQAGQFRV